MAMYEVDNGGAAFPVASGMGNITFNPGMSLRDYFASAAMSGMLSDPRVDLKAGETGLHFATRIAISSYVHADAMLAARTSTTKEQP